MSGWLVTLASETYDLPSSVNNSNSLDKSESETDPYVLFPNPLVKKLPSPRVSPLSNNDCVTLTDAATLGWSKSILSSTPSSKRGLSPFSKRMLPAELVPDSNVIPPFSKRRNPFK